MDIKALFTVLILIGTIFTFYRICKPSEITPPKVEYFILNFTAPAWCPPCKYMDEEVWPHKDIVKIINERPYTLFHLDSDDKRTKEFFQAYKIKAVPTVLIVKRQDGKTKVVGRKVGQQEVPSLGGWLKKIR
jgi:thiol:disulfide interchange protein